MRALAWLFAALLLSACSCGRPPSVVDPDAGGPPPRPCEIETECELGESCVEGFCGPAVLSDAGPRACATTADCDPGYVCVPSTGVCIIEQIEDAGTPDAGQTGTCFEGQTQSCGSSKLGECKLGVSSCALEGGVWSFGPCSGAVNPAAEVCNAKDDDCDGLIDDGLGSSTCGVGACARTVDNCVGGQPQTCAPGPASAEVCDGIDNDCNGAIDDGIANLSCGVGACARSVAACVGGTPQTCTPGVATAEICNGADDNCDGQTDEGIGQDTCGLGVCRRTVDLCVGGVPQTCTPAPAGIETCNGVDDNCNGTVDEGCTCTPGTSQACYTGPAATRGVGRCADGTQQCVTGGSWDPCGGEITPGTETCNDLDDDCDGTKDEGLGQSSCGVGACLRTVQNCVGGVAQICTPGTPAATETCNDIDDDCDGTKDEDLGTTTCGIGACLNTIQACVGGVTQTCVPGTPGTEICNGLDDNCSGQADETFPQQNQSCPTGVPGACGAGQWQCPTGSLICNQLVFPQSEVCGDGIDQDCNGVIDDPIACGTCSTSIDRDLDGSNECLDCNDTDGTIHPGALETCNGKDDNCNGLIDETFDNDNDTFTTCGTVPGGGLDPKRSDCNDNNNYIFPLKMFDCGSAATPDAGNLVDDNCNGYVDETCTPCTDKDNDGYSTCQGDCNDSSAAIHPNAIELCDGKDNDCDKRTIDNCGVSDLCGERKQGNWVPWAAGTDQCRPDLVCVSNVQSGELTCGSFCNQTAGTGLNDSCSPAEGCNRNLVDSDNQHLCSVTLTGAKATGAACGNDSECRSGDCITSDGPTDYCKDMCTHQAGCSANTTCYLVQSLIANPNRYYYYSFCRLTSNITGTKTLGQSCTGSECRTGAVGCFGGKCTEPCCENTECGSGYVCSMMGPKISTGYQTGGDPIFSVVPACLASTATRVSGQACSASSECKSGICDKSRLICVDVCCNDSSCPNGTTCEPVSFKFSTGQRTYMRGCVFAPVPALIEQK